MCTRDRLCPDTGSALSEGSTFSPLTYKCQSLGAGGSVSGEVGEWVVRQSREENATD